MMLDSKQFANAIDISIPLKFNGSQPNLYGVEPARSTPVEAGDLVGDTRLGGSCNFEQITLIPHCNGTHTECVGHVTNKRITVRDCLQDVFIPAVLVSVEPEKGQESDEKYTVELSETDQLLTRKILRSAGVAGGANSSSAAINSAAQALIIRTLPNDDSKLSRTYDDIIPPFFSTEAMGYILELGFKHLLVDLPSIDRLFDEGRLSNHRIFWNVELRSFETNANTRIDSTITELIYVPNDIEDGEYLLNLQIAPFESDASPSRPILFRLK